MEEVGRHNEALKRDVMEAHAGRRELQGRYEQTLEEHRAQMQREYEQRQKLIGEKSELGLQLRQAQQTITEQTMVVDKQQLMITERDNEIARLRALLAVLEDVKLQRDELVRQLREAHEARGLLSVQIEELVRQHRELRAKDEAHFEELIQARRKAEEEIVALQRLINDKDTTIKTLTAKNLEMQQRIHSLEAVVAVKDDISEKLEMAN